MIVTLGESVFDIIFSNGQPVSSVFGGSMFNVAVSLGRSNVSVAFAGFRAKDKIGNESALFLKENNVETQYFKGVENTKSNVALAFLDQSGKPTYSFYRDKELRGQKIVVDFSEVNIFLIGSFFAITSENFNLVIELVKEAIQNNVLIAYDPNIRNHNVYADKELLARVKTLIQYADFVKLSDEDLTHITGFESMEQWTHFMSELGVRKFAITRGEKDVCAFYDNQKIEIPVPGVNVVSTVGAGDATTAGILSYGAHFTENIENFENALKRGVQYGSHVCTLSENFITKDFKTD